MEQDDRPALLTTRRLALGYHGRPVVADIDLTVRHGDFWVLLGPNGRGKTSLVKAILGLLKPLAGELRLAIGRRRLGFVPQRCELDATLPMTVREFVELGLVNLPAGKAERRRRVLAALDEIGLAERATDSMGALSGGQQQRTLIARALVRAPSLLLLDEPTTGLDIAAEEGLLRCVNHLHRHHGLTVILVTHDLELTRHATHAGIFADGTMHAMAMRDPATADMIRRSFGLADEAPGGTP